MRIYLILFNSTQRSIIDYAMTTRLSLTSISAVFKVVATKKKKRKKLQRMNVYSGDTISLLQIYLLNKILDMKFWGLKVH